MGCTWLVPLDCTSSDRTNEMDVAGWLGCAMKMHEAVHALEFLTTCRCQILVSANRQASTPNLSLYVGSMIVPGHCL